MVKNCREMSLFTLVFSRLYGCFSVSLLYGKFQNQSLYEDGLGIAVQPTFRGCHCLAEPVPIDDALPSHDGRTERLGI